jgi:hypothetical protein
LYAAEAFQPSARAGILIRFLLKIELSRSKLAYQENAGENYPRRPSFPHILSGNPAETRNWTRTKTLSLQSGKTWISACAEMTDIIRLQSMTSKRWSHEQGNGLTALVKASLAGC